MYAGEVGSGPAAFDFQEVRVLCGSGRKGDDRLVGTDIGVESDEREHLAADCLVAYPEYEVVAPLHGLYNVGQGEKEVADGLDAHGGSLLLP